MRSERKIADALQPRQRILPWLTLNEVTSHVNASTPLSPIDNIHRVLSGVHGRIFGIEADHVDEQMKRRDSSDICVCTGSGPRSWFKRMNLQTAETVQTLVAMTTGSQLDEKETHKVLHKYHSNLLFLLGNEL